ncbi:uncharacterized protein LOC112044332 [Bicyclus anynana]|uniref:Uncharacterized protein LOC112044332 n=1 Tax=Bicyclus anynana TaxID=110368 RepID=A0ABM3LYJ3_BICAN|nr:uncharacterized protein LOC112044332 [Bicyclus anynana]
MSVKSSRMYTAPVPKMPPGLIELMEGLAKDVLKCNPPDVYSFCADHMMKLIEIRDGPIPKREMTLEQKIAIANKKRRQRAAQRSKDYDKEMKTQLASQNNEGNVSIEATDKNNSETGQYIKDNIVIIPDKDIIGDIEHEIIVNKEENTLTLLSPKTTEPNTDNILKSINSIETDLSPDPLYDSIQVNDVKVLSHINVIENNEDIEVLQDKYNENVSITLHQNDINTVEKLGDFQPDEEICLEPVAENENDTQNTQTTVNIIENKDYLECETLIVNNNDKEKPQIEANIQENVCHLNKETNVFVVENEHEEKIIDDHTDMAKPLDIDVNDADDRNDKIGYSESDPHTCSPDKQDDEIFHKVDDNDIPNDNKAEFQNDKSAHKDDDTDILNDSKIELQNHINNTPMDLETAAITIQKVFRNFLFKNKTLSSDDVTNIDINLLIEDKNEQIENDDISRTNINKDRRTLGLSRMDTVLQTVNEEKSLSQSTDDSSTLSSAATIIQAHVRGFLIRNKYNLNKNSSTTSGVDSDGLSLTSIEGDNDNRKNKTVLNIHIVPENGHFMSRDESVLTSIDLSLDGSPPDSANLHPQGYERSERRKQLRREDAIQSISPPSNNSGKSEDIDSVKELVINKENNKHECMLAESDYTITDAKEISSTAVSDLNDVNILTMVGNLDTALEVKSLGPIDSPVKHDMTERPHSLPEMTSDEMDVITPFTPSEDKLSNDANLIHSSEFHEVVLPTKVARSDTSVVREFQNVLVYFLLWNNA